MSQYQFMPAPDPAQLPVLPPRSNKTKLPDAAARRSMMLLLGPALLAVLVVFPIWNAYILLHDEIYLFFGGDRVPVVTISLCAGTVVLYALSLMIFFCFARPQAMTEQTVVLIVMMFISLLGLSLVLCALPLAKQAINSHHNILHRCDYSEQTHYLYEYSQSLQSVRQTGDCRQKASVELCSGFAAQSPYTEFLKTMETELRCSGFCYQPSELPDFGPGASALPAANQSAAAEAWPDALDSDFGAGASSLRKGSRVRTGQSPVRLSADQAQRVSLSTFRPDEIPPTLFSNANFKAPCDAIAARDMKHLVGDMSYQNFMLGCYLLVIAIASGVLKLLGMCILKDDDASLHN